MRKQGSNYFPGATKVACTGLIFLSDRFFVKEPNKPNTATETSNAHVFAGIFVIFVENISYTNSQQYNIEKYVSHKIS